MRPRWGCCGARGLGHSQVAGRGGEGCGKERSGYTPHPGGGVAKAGRRGPGRPRACVGGRWTEATTLLKRGGAFVPGAVIRDGLSRVTDSSRIGSTRARTGPVEAYANTRLGSVGPGAVLRRRWLDNRSLPATKCLYGPHSRRIVKTGGRMGWVPRMSTGS